ncbi:MAG: GTP pyrophosphokinase [Lachnospiraceae bacterium]|nr:GTP pyrophosphokinase [Lachnospiraceae bacterium]
MIYTDLTKKAMQIAYDAHYGQVDRGNTPYICHPLHLADQMDTEEETLTALLHDVLEDTHETARSLIEQGIPGDIVENVLLLTRREEETYEAYIGRLLLSGNRCAMKVKLADLNHNLDVTRTENNYLPEYLIRRYTEARARILRALDF